jgi:hypothetical protein
MQSLLPDSKANLNSTTFGSWMTFAFTSPWMVIYYSKPIGAPLGHAPAGSPSGTKLSPNPHSYRP